MQYDYGARFYNSEIGRWGSMDPLAEKYYSASPYAYCNNNSILYVDPNGMDVLIWYKDENDKWQTWSFNGSNHSEAPKNEFVGNFIRAYDYNVGNGGGDNLKKAATSTDFTINLSQTAGASRRKDIDVGKRQSQSFVLWNPERGLETDEGHSMSPATILEHEVDHGVRHEIDFQNFRKDDIDYNDVQYDTKEERRVITGSEAKTARANGEFPKNYVRKSHSGGKSIIVPSPTSNKKIKYVY